MSHRRVKTAESVANQPWSTQDHVRVVPSLLRQINAVKVIEHLRREGSLSRADLMRRTGISAPTISGLVEHLLQAQLVEETDTQRDGIGRPAKVFRLVQTARQVQGVVVDVQTCQLVQTGMNGAYEEASEMSTPPSYPGLIDQLEKACSELSDRAGVKPCTVALTAPGLVDYQSQRVIYSPNLHYLDGRKPGEDLSRRLGMPVLLVHEEEALCEAERVYGEADGVDNFLLVDVSSGVGMTAISGGRYVRGARGMGGELGHMTVTPEGDPCGCGNRGCLETEVNDRLFLDRMRQRLGDETLSMDDIIQRVRAGEVDAMPVIEPMFRALAMALSAMINVFSPEAIFLVGRVFDVLPDGLAMLTSEVGERALPPLWQNCTLRRTTGSKLKGAVAVAIGRVITDSVQGG